MGRQDYMCKLFGVLCALCAVNVSAHSRLQWPDPRNDRANNIRLRGELSDSACGLRPPAIKTDAAEIKPGLLTIWIKEAIKLDGSPWRIELTTETSDVESCVLLDNIPHSLDAPSPSYGDSSTWNDYYITVRIPDVDCGVAGCSIVMYNPIAENAACRNDIENAPVVNTPPKCGVVYHSCSNPLKFIGKKARSTFSDKGESCFKDDATDYAVIKAADGTAISWMSPENVKTEVPQTPNVYRRESAKWSDGLLSTGFDDVQVSPDTNSLEGPVKSIYYASHTDPPTSPNGLSAFGIIVLIILFVGLVGLLVFVHVKSNAAEEGKGIWSKAVQFPHRYVGVVAIRAAEILVAIINIIVISASGGPVFITGVTVTLLIYLFVPFSAVGLLVHLQQKKNEEPPKWMISINKLQTSNPGAAILLAIEGLLFVLIIIAAGLSCVYYGTGSPGIAFLTFFQLILEMPIVFMKCAIFFTAKSGDIEAATAAATVPQQPPKAKPLDELEKTEPASDANAPPLAPSPTICIGEFDYQETRDDELTFFEGDRIQILNERTDGWARGVLLSSEADPKPEGMFPLNYTKREE